MPRLANCPTHVRTIITATELAQALSAERRNGRSIGFVPTMGALHLGHATLIEHATRANDVTVASIFVNPTQFNEVADLEAYPHTPDEDARLLNAYACDYLYLPSIEDVYPEGTNQSLTARLDLGELATRMEGRQRPGHFAGVVQVVSRLLSIVEPTVLYLGQKDYQQVAVIKRMIHLLGLTVEVAVVPTVREADGLALSSRNRRLTPEQRAAAGKINQHLAVVAAGLRSGWPARELERLALRGLQSVPLLEPEYVEVVDGATLLPYQDGQPAEEVVVATAVRVGAVRLIDNRIAYRGVSTPAK